MVAVLRVRDMLLHQVARHEILQGQQSYLTHAHYLQQTYWPDFQMQRSQFQQLRICREPGVS
jgi:hypothetical protein